MESVDYGIIYCTKEDIEREKKCLERYIEETKHKIEEMEKVVADREKEKKLEDKFTKVNNEEVEWQSEFVPIELQSDYVPFQPDDYVGGDTLFYFEFEGNKYYLNDFLRVHDNPWFSGDDFPTIIDGVYSNDTVDPIFVHLIGDYAVDIYKRK